MKILLPVVISILMNCLSLFAQYNDGTVIYSETNQNTIQKNYKIVYFDGDNFADILFIKDENQNQLTWYKGDGTGKFSDQNVLYEVKEDYKENEIFYEDMNQDGVDDIVFQNNNIGFTTLLNDGQGNISAQIENEIATEEFAGVDLKELADVDNDGDIDGIFFAKTDSMSFWGQQLGHCIIAYNDGTGTFSNYSILDNEDYSIFHQVETGDIDGDGDIDIVCNGERFFYNPKIIYISYVRNFFSFVRIYKNTGLNSFAPTEEIELPDRTYFVNIKLQDINADGYEELLVEKSFSDINECEDQTHLTFCETIKQFEVFRYGPQNEIFSTIELYDFWLHDYTFEEETNYATELQNQAFHIQFGYQNTDNSLDVLSVNVPQRRLQWHLGDGDGSFNNTQTVNLNDEYSNIRPSIRVADVDNDNDLDIFVLLNNGNSSTLTVFKNETPVSIAEKDFLAVNLSFTPNPVKANSNIQLTSTQNQNMFKATYNLYSLQGIKLITGNIEDNHIFIPNTKTGVYIIEMNLDKKTYIDKLIIH